jgi:hypothetical protein
MAKKMKPARAIQNGFLIFLENHPPAQFSSNLRRMVLDYVQYELKEGAIPLYLDELLYGLNEFFDLLDTAAKDLSIKA